MDNEVYKMKVLELMETQVSLLRELLAKKEKPKREKKVLPELSEQIKPFINSYAPAMLTEFIDYWSECERWKREKTWDIEKRLIRWKRQQDKWQHEKEARSSLKQVEERPTQREVGGYTNLRPISEILSEKLNQ